MDNKYFNWLLLPIAILMIIYPLIMTYGPKIEGYLFPVVINTDITKMVEVEPNVTDIYGAREKVRDCTYLQTRWFYGKQGTNSSLIPLEISGQAQIFDVGDINFGPWRLNIDRSVIRSQTYAVFYHQCHPFWVTPTVFWPPDDHFPQRSSDLEIGLVLGDNWFSLRGLLGYQEE